MVKLMHRCQFCDLPFDPRFVWQRYCSRACYEMERRFRERLRFDQSKVWDWNRAGIAIALAIALLAGCAKPRPRAQIPDPAGVNTYLVYDGQQLVWRELVGGPSGAIDTVSHPGEIELVPGPTAKYLRSPISYAQSPAAGQVVVYAAEQAIEASSISADVLGIANGVLVPAKLPEPGPAPSSRGRTILGWTGDAYVTPGAKVYLTWGSLPPAGAANRVFAMPAAGRLTNLIVATRTIQPRSGGLEFTLSKAGITQSLQVTIAEGAPPGLFTTSFSADIAANDLVQIEVINRAQVNSAYFNSITAVYEY